eukprot:11181226-Lingulodinium_polyedra.AAC.1
MPAASQLQHLPLRGARQTLLGTQGLAQRPSRLRTPPMTAWRWGGWMDEAFASSVDVVCTLVATDSSR